MPVQDRRVLFPAKQPLTGRAKDQREPACGNGGLVRFFDANNWVTSFLPHYKHRTSSLPPNPPAGFWKRTLENWLKGRTGDKLDDLFRGLTARRWNKKERRGALNGKGH